MRGNVIIFALASAVAFGPVGCGARTGNELDRVAAAGSAGDDATAPSVGAVDEVPMQYPSPQDACLASSRSTHAYASESDLASLLVGRWMLCNPGTPNPYWSAEGVGLDLLTGGLAYPLYRGNSGQIMRGSGDYVWRYRVAPGQGTAFDLAFDGGGEPTFHSVLTDDPRKLVLDDGQTRYTFAPAQ